MDRVSDHELLSRIRLKQKRIDELALALRDYDNVLYNAVEHGKPVTNDVFNRHSETVRMAGVVAHTREIQDQKSERLGLMYGMGAPGRNKWQRGRHITPVPVDWHKVNGGLYFACERRGRSDAVCGVEMVSGPQGRIRWQAFVMTKLGDRSVIMAHPREGGWRFFNRQDEAQEAAHRAWVRCRDLVESGEHFTLYDDEQEQARRMTADHEMGGSLIGAYRARGGSWAEWRSRPKRLWPHQEAAMDWLRTAGYDRLFHSGGLVVDMRKDMIDNMVLETLDRKVADRLEWAWQKHGENHAGCFWSDAAQDYVWMGLVTPDPTVGWKPWLTVHDSRVAIDTSFQREMTLNEAKLVCELELKGELPRRAYSRDARAADCWWVGRRLVGPGVNGATIVEAWQVGSQWRAERRAGSGLHRSVEPMYWRRQPGSLEEARQGLEAVVDFTCLPA